MPVKDEIEDNQRLNVIDTMNESNEMKPYQNVVRSLLLFFSLLFYCSTVSSFPVPNVYCYSLKVYFFFLFPMRYGLWTIVIIVA